MSGNIFWLSQLLLASSGWNPGISSYSALNSLFLQSTTALLHQEAHRAVLSRLSNSALRTEWK